MAIAPLVNAGTTPNVRRPRPIVSETEVVAGPFDLTLYATGAVTEHLTTGVSVGSTRVAITTTTTAPTTEWGQDFTYAGDVPVAGVHVRSE